MADRADLVFRNGVVWDPSFGPDGESTALAVRQGLIVAVGEDAESLARDAVEVVDLDGGALIPSFGDGHAHPVQAGVALRFADVSDASSVEEIAANVAAWAAAHPDEPWVRGDGYPPELAAGGLFDAAWLDAVVPDRPVWLRASDYHTAWVNSRALELAGIDRDTPDPPDGEIPRREDGSPLGTLREWGAWRKVEAVAPPLTDEVLRDALLDSSQRLAALGITWVQDAWAEPPTVRAWLDAAASGLLRVRGNLALLGNPATWRDDLGRLVEQRDLVAREGRGLVTAHTVKFFADGIIEAGTGALLAPYVDCPHSQGMPNWDWAELAEAVTAVDALGFQPHIHAIGDAAVRASLDAFAAADRRNGRRDRRAVTAHTQLVDPADLPRYAELDVIANFEPLWACADVPMTELTEPRIGPERSRLQYPMATLGERGRISFGSDWPVSSADPLKGISVAVTHLSPEAPPGVVWLPEQRISITEAFAAYTAGVAYQAGEEGSWGTLAPGGRADLLQLSADPRSVDPQALASIDRRGTWMAGVRTA